MKLITVYFQILTISAFFFSMFLKAIFGHLHHLSKTEWYDTLSLKRKLTDTPRKPSIKPIFYEKLYKVNDINNEVLLRSHPGFRNGFSEYSL